MKKSLFLVFVLGTLFACSKNPTACECGKNLMKVSSEQDADLAEDCERFVESLPDTKQMQWYNETIACMNEQ
jgi:hypothetical protein